MISRFEFQKLDWCTVVEDERDPHAGRRRVRRNQDVLAFERGIQIVDGKRQVRDGLHNLRHRTLRVEAHPLDTVRAGLEPADVDAELLQVPLTATGRAVRDAEVVVSPSEPRNDRGIFVPRRMSPTVNPSSPWCKCRAAPRLKGDAPGRQGAPSENTGCI